MTKCKRCGKIDAGVHTCTPLSENNELEEFYENLLPNNKEGEN